MVSGLGGGDVGTSHRDRGEMKAAIDMGGKGESTGKNPSEPIDFPCQEKGGKPIDLCGGIKMTQK